MAERAHRVGWPYRGLQRLCLWALLAPLPFLGSACSASLLAGSGSYTVTEPRVPAVGVKATTIADLALLEGTSVAVGLQTVFLQRVQGGADDFGQFRLLALGGLAQLPRPHESFVGWEAFLTAGMARVYADTAPDLRFAAGTQLGLPLRLSGSKPRWRSDDLAAGGLYLVPSAGATWFAPKTLEVTAGLSLRVTLWSAILP